MSNIKGSFRNYVNMFEFETELPGTGEIITFRPITTGQLKKLLLYETSNDPTSIEKALDDVITECVISPETFDIKKLYLQDRFFLLVEIRKATRGSSYEFQTTCSKCNSQTQHVLNITDLTVKKLQPIETIVTKLVPVEKKKLKKSKISEVTSEQPEIEMKEVTTLVENNIVKLNDYISVKLSLLTREMQIKAFEIFNKNHPKDINNIDDINKTLELTTLVQALSIISIITPEGEETELTLEDKIFLLDNINQDELIKITEWFDNNDFGIDFSFDVVCAQCGNTERKAVPVENFFY